MTRRVHTPVRIQREGNPHWPLPPDYHARSHDAEYQRVARVNAASLWRLRDATREEAVASWAFFREYYLLADDEGGFNPGFYDPPVKPPAAGHYQLLGWLHEHDFIAVGAPRHWAKSTTKRSIFLHRIVTGHYYKITSVVAKEDFGITEMHYIRSQLEDNERILADFGEQRPAKGSGIWNMHAVILVNRCEYRILSVEGKKRGTRGHLNVCDDIEFDDDYKSRGPAVLQKLKEELLRVIVPMGGKGSKILLLGTMVSKQSLHYQIVCTEDDKRFTSRANGGLWFKINIPAFDAQGRNAWADQYTPEYIHEKRTSMGESFFRTEYMGDPRSEEDSPFSVDQRCEYTVGGVHPACDLLAAPLTHAASVSPGSGSFGDAVSKMHRIMCVDYAEGLTTAHDYSAITVCGLDKDDVLWVLDCWHGRVRTPKLADKIWELASRWRVRTIAVEAVAAQIEVFRAVKQHIFLKAGDTDWTPLVWPLKYPANLSKGDRISTLEWRFNQGRIKFPTPQSVVGHKSFPVLMQQVRDFTPDLRGLATDDLVDSLAMHQIALKSATPHRDSPKREINPIDRILAGELHVPGTSIPWASMVVNPLPSSVENVMLWQAYRKAERYALATQPEYPQFMTAPFGLTDFVPPEEDCFI